MRLVVCVMASKEDSTNVTKQSKNDQLECQKHITERLEDAEARDLMIKKLREGGHVEIHRVLPREEHSCYL